MKTPTKNPETEAHAQAIANAMNSENTEGFIDAIQAAKMDEMKKWELIEFRDRVRYLAEEGKSNAI